MATPTLGIIGCNGRIGRLHTETLASRLPECDVRWACDVQPEEAQASARRWNIPRWTTDYREVLCDSQVDAVVICSPTSTHVSSIIAAAEAGKHIFCEKPVDLSPQRIVEAISAVRQNRVKLQIGFMKRFDPEYVCLKEKVDKGEVGDQHIVRISSRDSALPPPEYVFSSGGMFLDMTCHDFDLVRYLTGSEVEEVFAFGSVRLAEYFRQAQDFDTAVISFRLQNGAVGSIDNSRKTNYGYDQRVEVFGSKGCVIADHVKHSNIVTLNEHGIVADKPMDWFIDRYSNAYLAEMRRFFEMLRDDQEPSVTAMDGLKATLVAMAVKKSADENRAIKVDYSLCKDVS